MATALLCFFQPAAQAKDWFIDVGFGAGAIEVDIENPVGVVEELASDDAGVMGSIGGGYALSETTFVRLTYTDFGSIAPLLLFTQRIEYSSLRAGVGFEYPAKSRLALNVEAGAAFWDIKVRESGLGNPGPEDTATVDGIDLYGRIGIVVRFTKRFEMGVHRDYERNDLGTADSGQIGFRFRF